MVSGPLVISFMPVKGLFESGTVTVNLYPDLYGAGYKGRAWVMRKISFLFCSACYKGKSCKKDDKMVG